MGRERELIWEEFRKKGKNDKNTLDEILQELIKMREKKNLFKKKAERNKQKHLTVTSGLHIHTVQTHAHTLLQLE